MAVKARFYVAEVSKKAYGAGPGYGSVTMQAVTRKTGDNVDWAQATPSGTFTMNINAAALAFFDGLLGKDVAITIEEAIDPPVTAEAPGQVG